MARNENFDQIVIFEDDVEFSPNFENEFLDLEIPSDFDLFYFGGAHYVAPQHITKNIYKVFNTVTLHAVIVKKTIYDRIINEIENNPAIQVDVAYSKLQPQINAYVVLPHLAWQRSDYSDIQNKFVDYPWLRN